MRRYRTVSGDTWDYIALKTMGNEKYMDQLIEANIAQRETVVFAAGITLNVPNAPARKMAVLPPWKK